MPLLGGATFQSAADSQVNLTQAQSGLIALDPLNSTQSEQQLESQNINTSWGFGGHYSSMHIDLVNQAWVYSRNGVQKNVNVNFSESQHGLVISLQAVSPGTYTGFYAASQSSGANLFHAVINSPYKSISSGSLQIGLYVGAASGNVNYVACAAVTGNNGTYWEIIHGTGNSYEATNFNYLWIDKTPAKSATRDCTIETNGDNFLAVYLDGSLVYQSNSLALGIQKPFKGYLEMESSYNNQVFSGTWKDFYSTRGGDIAIINAPPDSSNVSVFSQSGGVLASAPVSNGSAEINVAEFHFPLSAYIKIFGSNGTEIASTGNLVSLYGGDVYTGKITLPQRIGSVVGFLSGSTLLYLAIPVGGIFVIAIVAYGISKNRRTIKQSALQERERTSMRDQELDKT